MWREHGIPAIGSGVVYAVNPKDIKIDPIAIPPFWKQLYALDPGIRRTAALWMAWDTNDDVIYLKSEHYSASEVPSVHAAAIKARGEINGISWIPGVIDPSSNNRSLTDGQRLIQQYRDLGLNLVPAKNAVESGIYRVQELFAQGRVRVFASLGNFFDELRWYRRGEDRKIVKEHDHLMDCLRYLIHEYETHAIVKPVGMDRRTRYRPGSASVGY